MTGYAFTLTCLRDGAELVPVAAGLPYSTESSAISKCVQCSSEYVVTVLMRPVAWEPADERLIEEQAVCGTVAGYQRHIRAGEEPCDPCVYSHRDQISASKRRRRERELASVS